MLENEKIFKYEIKDQRKNKNQPYETCNVTSLSMAFDCVGIKIDPDTLYLKANSTEMKSWAKKTLGTWTENYSIRNDLNQVWGVLEKLADDIIGDKNGGTFKDNWLTFADIIDYIDKGCPVLIGGLFTHGGHIVCVVGYNSIGLICADPWGDWITEYKDHNGKNVLYPYEKLRPILSGKDQGYFRALVIKNVKQS